MESDMRIKEHEISLFCSQEKISKVEHIQDAENAKPISTCNKKSKAKAVECMEV